MKTFLSLFVSFWVCSMNACTDTNDVVPTSPPGAEDNPAVKYLADVLADYDKRLYVYKDFSDGVNNFTQKAWVGMNYNNVPPMVETAQGYESHTGIAISLHFMQHKWGGYMFINGVLPAAATIPYNSMGEHDAGLDLSGASKLIFYARGETGEEQVEFFMAGLGRNEEGEEDAKYPDSSPTISLGYVRLSKQWKRYEINLKGAKLSRIGCGFGWVSNYLYNRGAKEIKFYVDEIYYSFDQSALRPQFLASYAAAQPATDAAVINNFSYLYDNCVAAIALSRAGYHERSQQIADGIVYALHHDRYFSDGRLRNAYMNGNPQSFPGWFSTLGKPFARMPGFWDAKTNTWYEDYYAVSTSTGNLAWAILALCEVYKQSSGRQEYLRAACEIGDFVLTLKAPHNHGFRGGIEGFDETSGATPLTYISSEHNIDLYTAFGLLDRLSGGSQIYREASEDAKAFVLSMYDSERHCFYTGTLADGLTTDKTILPLDCNTWALLALKEAFADGPAVMTFIEENMASHGGYGFNNSGTGSWLEGVSQVALCYLMLGNVEKYNAIIAYLRQNMLPSGNIYAADRDHVQTGFYVSGTTIPWEYGKREHIGATAWLALALSGANPL